MCGAGVEGEGVGGVRARVRWEWQYTPAIYPGNMPMPRHGIATCGSKWASPCAYAHVHTDLARSDLPNYSQSVREATC